MRAEASTEARPETVWRLLARPGRWHEWAPHLRGAEGLGEPEVTAGSSGTVSLLGMPVPARVTSVVRGRMWAWRVGPMTIEHRVSAHEGGSRISVDLHAPGPLELGLWATYGPLTAILVRNLARVAAGEERRAAG